MNNNLLKKFMQFALGNGIVLVLGLISSPIITRMVSPIEMGKYSMFNTVTNLLLVVVLIGMDQSYGRYYYEENEENRGLLVRTCITKPLIFNFIVCFIILILYKPITIYIVEEQSFLVAVLIVLHLTGSIIARFSLLQVRMKQKANLYSFLNIFMKLSYVALVALFFLIYKNSYMILVIAIVISNIFMALIGIAMERDEWFNTKTCNKLKTTSKEMVKYGIPFVFSMAVTWIFQSIDRVAIKQYCGYDEVGLYSGAMSIIALLNAVQYAFTTFWFPVAYEKYTNNPEDKEFFVKINKIVSVSMLFIAIGLIASKDIIILLLGEKYRQAMYIFPYLVFMPIMYTISETTVIGINFKKKTRSHIYIAIISAAVNIVGNVILVPKFGAVGAAISTGLAYIVFFIVRTYISNKYYYVNYNLGKFIIATIITYILATYSSFNRGNIVLLILTVLSVAVISFIYIDVLKDAISFAKIKLSKKR